jgi:hypothetical protein
VVLSSALCLNGCVCSFLFFFCDQKEKKRTKEKKNNAMSVTRVRNYVSEPSLRWKTSGHKFQKWLSSGCRLNNYSEVSFSFCLRFSFFKKKNEVAPLGAKQPTLELKHFNPNQSNNNIYGFSNSSYLRYSEQINKIMEFKHKPYIV